MREEFRPALSSGGANWRPRKKRIESEKDQRKKEGGFARLCKKVAGVSKGEGRLNELRERDPFTTFSSILSLSRKKKEIKEIGCGKKERGRERQKKWKKSSTLPRSPL